MKIIQKVSFNIASEASYVCILSGQKFTKSRFCEFLKNSVTRQIHNNRTKIGGNGKIQMRHFESFSNNMIMYFAGNLDSPP